MAAVKPELFATPFCQKHSGMPCKLSRWRLALEGRLQGMMKVTMRKRERRREVSTGTIVRLPFKQCLATILHPIQPLKGRLG